MAFLDNGFLCSRVLMISYTCDCGCNKKYRFKTAWRVGYDEDEADYISTEEYPTIEDVNALYMKNYHEGEWVDIANNISKEEFINLPYNIHVFTVKLDTMNGKSTYMLLRLQEMPDICGTGPTYSAAEKRLKEKMGEWFDLHAKYRIPMPQKFDPNFSLDSNSLE